jgi:hypothetical protein
MVLKPPRDEKIRRQIQASNGVVAGRIKLKPL